jgi:hypothetical protein
MYDMGKLKPVALDDLIRLGSRNDGGYVARAKILSPLPWGSLDSPGDPRIPDFPIDFGRDDLQVTLDVSGSRSLAGAPR